MLDPGVLREVVCEDVYRARHLMRGARVLDIGANVGVFAAWALRMGAREVVAVEPGDHPSLDALPVRRVRAAVWSRAGEMCLEGGGGGARLAPCREGLPRVPLVPLDDLIDGPFDVCKLDVEGAEYAAVPAATRLGLCAYIAMEFHPGPLGRLVEHLSETHSVTVLGSWRRGGYLWAHVY
ncbi:MAG: hypothetical protein KatS3mg014_2540 [Actinomycetota bacterium]|nr:MAG: hypothetical protein KatS3mg014_2465 [Actinomycetota bacterium]GIV00925.1 MAG: hypothetical protein KatS3mg014_2540 [Actinomycetota bacterium]